MRTTQNSEQAVNNGNLKPFKKGQSGNPGGRPKEVAEVKALARAHTITAINTLVKIAKSDKATDAARVSASVALLDRGLGQARQDASPRWRHSPAHHIRQASDAR